MARFTEIVNALRRQLAQDGERVTELKEEINKVRPAYNLFRDLSEESKRREARMLTTAALLGRMLSDNERAGAFSDELLNLEDSKTLQGSPTLWEALVEILRHVPEARMNELQTILEMLEVKTTRQAIESAIHTHRKAFRVRRRGREKFISLAAS